MTTDRRGPMATDRSVLAGEIENAVRSTGGVTALYRPGSLMQNVLAAGAEAIGLADDASLIAVDEGEPRAVRVSIGVRDDAGAAATIHRVHEVIAEVLARHGSADASVQLTVAHVAEGPLVVESTR